MRQMWAPICGELCSLCGRKVIFNFTCFYGMQPTTTVHQVLSVYGTLWMLWLVRIFWIYFWLTAISRLPVALGSLHGNYSRFVNVLARRKPPETELKFHVGSDKQPKNRTKTTRITKGINYLFLIKKKMSGVELRRAVTDNRPQCALACYCIFLFSCLTRFSSLNE